MSNGFDKSTIPDLTGRVILVTGGIDAPIFTLYRPHNY